MNANNKLALGTVQWGRPYGIANHTGQPTSDEVGRILDLAYVSGVALLDTAHGYGTAEAVLGRWAAGKRFRLVTKVPRIAGRKLDAETIAGVESQFRESLRRLGVSTVYGLLLHHADDLDLDGADELWAMLSHLKAAGLVEKIGVSVYHPRQLVRLAGNWPIEIVQLPFNLYDQRFLSTGWLAKLKSAGVEIHARSIFLQGLLVTSGERLAPFFGRMRGHHDRLFRRWKELGISPVTGALGFALAEPNIDYIVVGCEKLGQLQDLLDVTARQPLVLTDSSMFALTDESYLDPSQWP